MSGGDQGGQPGGPEGGGMGGWLGGARGVRLTGRVVEFDPEVGLGRVREAASGAIYPFHCTQIAGGSRTIEVGTEVGYTVVAGRVGRWEAAGLGPA